MRTPAFAFALICPLTWSGGTTAKRTPRNMSCNRKAVLRDNKSHLAINEHAYGCMKWATIVIFSCQMDQASAWLTRLPDNWTLALAASGLPNELSTDVKRTEWKWQQEKKRNRDFPKRRSIGRRDGADRTHRPPDSDQSSEPCNDGGHQ
jgi:hypothetical protein